jgi:SAM-dependent methyltransferase
MTFLRMAGKVVSEVAKNAAMRIPVVRQRRLSRVRAGATTPTDAAIERYALQGLRLLERQGVSVAGRSVVEFGPGDYLTSGLAILAAGATKYAALDRFVGDYSSASGLEWYRAVRDAWGRLQPGSEWPVWLDVSAFPSGYPDRIEFVQSGVETARLRDRFDIVCSFQVVEHVSDINAFARSTAELLAPGGVGLHRVDFGPHDWAGIGDPTTFLRFPNWLWRAMGSERGIPNRLRINEVVAALERAGLSVELADVELFDPEIDRSTLPRRYASTPVDALQVEAAVLTCRPRVVH